MVDGKWDGVRILYNRFHWINGLEVGDSGRNTRDV